MKTKIALSLIAGAVLFSGCASMSSPSVNTAFQKAQTNGGGLKEYITELNKNDFHGVKIYADKPNETILRTRVYNENGIGISDIYEVTQQLSNYCKNIGGKWIYGKQYGDFLKKYGSIYVNPILSLKTVPQQLKAEKSGYYGFGKCEAGKNGFEVKYELGRFAINGVNWSRFYKVVFNKPQKIDDYIVRSNHKLLTENPYFKNWNSFVKEAQKKSIDAFGAGANFLANSYIICLNYGGKMYIANKATNFKKMNFNDYVFKQIELLHSEYPYGTDGNSNINELSLFAVTSNKGYIWCENPNNPQYQFTYHLINNWDKYIFEPYLDKNVKNVLLIEENNKNINKNFNKKNNLQTLNSIKRKLQILNHSKNIDDKNAENLAKGMFNFKNDIKVDSNDYVKYYGYYIGKIGNCEYASVDKKTKNMDFIYNFKQCDGNFEYTGQTLKGLTKAEYNRFNPYINSLKESCKVDGKAMVNVNGYNLYCKANPSGNNLKIFILDSKYRMIDML